MIENIKSRLFTLILLMSVAGGSLVAQDCATVGNNLISNCSFETGSTAGWVPVNSVSVVFGGAQQGSYYASIGSASRIDQSFSLISGLTYNYSFWYNNNDAKLGSFNIRSNSGFAVGPINLANTSGVWTQIQGSFVAGVSGSYTIGFLGASSPLINIDNVIVALSIPVPEPASLLLLGSMGSAIVGYKLKNRKIRE